MQLTPMEVVKAILDDPTNIDVVGKLTSSSATYVSLNYDNPALHKVMPWAGTGAGAKGIVDTFVRVNYFWNERAFEIQELFGYGENVAVFGRFTYKSTRLGKVVTSPFAILAKVVDGKLTYMQFMEDTFATAESFRSRGVWYFESDPDGGEVQVGDD